MQPATDDFPTLADFLPARPAWMAQGACRNRPDLTWFPERGQSAAPAKAVCAGCPQKAPCVAYAIEADAVGVWGRHEHAGAASDAEGRLGLLRLVSRTAPRGGSYAESCSSSPCSVEDSVETGRPPNAA